MTEKNLTISLACIAILSGCANIDDSFSAYRRNLPDDAPKGYASYLDALDDLKEKDYSRAAYNFCDAAKLGYSKANSFCARYSIIGASARAATYLTDDSPYPRTHTISKESEQKYISDMMRWSVCKGAKYGEPAKSLCKKIQSMSDQDTIKAVHNAKKQYFNNLNKQRVRSVKQKNQGLNLKLEEF